jgi:hypothetical protein
MFQPCDRVAADAAIPLCDVGPVGVCAQPEKNTRGALVCALGQHDFVAFAESGSYRFIAHRVRNLLRIASPFDYLAAIGVPISVPIISPEITSSTRRFCCQPCAVSFEAAG